MIRENMDSKASIYSFQKFTVCRWVWAGFLTVKATETMLSPILYGYSQNWWFFLLFGLCEIILVALACYCIVKNLLATEKTVNRMLAFVLMSGGVARLVEFITTGQRYDQIVLSCFLWIAMLYVQWTYDSIFTSYLNEAKLIEEIRKEGSGQ